MMPDRKIPSNVPAPPILMIREPNRENSLKFNRSAPMRVPRVPETYAVICLYSPPNNIAENAANSGGTRLGVTIPTPLTG